MIGLIPAAGSGTRMLPFTKANPKELFPIERKAVLDHVVETLHKEAGIDKIFVIVGNHKGAIIDHLGSGSSINKDKLKIAYIFQEERLGLAHAILQAKDWINEDFIAHVGDAFVYPKDEIKKAVEIHIKEKPLATIMAREIEDPTHYGILKIDNKNNIIDTIEKPTIEQAKPFKINNKYLVNLGIYIFSPKIFEYIQKTPKGLKGEYQVPDTIKMAIKNKEKIKAVITNGRYLDIGNWESAEEAWDFLRIKNKF